MMKTYEEMSQNVLNRIEKYKTEQKKRQKTAMKIAAHTVGFCLAAVITVGIRQSGVFRVQTPFVDAGQTVSDGFYSSNDSSSASDGNSDSSNPVGSIPVSEISEQDTPNPANNPTEQTYNEIPSPNGVCFFWWNHLNVGGSLYHAIQNNPNSEFFIAAAYRPTTADITSFIYEGKTLEEWAVNAYEANASQASKEGYRLAYNAYLETVLPSAVRQLSENNIPCERLAVANDIVTFDANDILTFFATAETLANLPLDNLENWYFYLASDSGVLS